jgi:isopenicillin N synthase-like dioxygenase
MITPLSNDPSKETKSDTPRTSSEVMHAANLRTIDLGRLQKGDEAEALKLFEACKDDGVFYLDFSSEECIKMMDQVKDLFTVSKRLFELSEEEKMRFDIDNLGRLKLNG